MTASAMVVIAPCASLQGEMLQAAAASQGLVTRSIGPDESLLGALPEALADWNGPAVVLADMSRVCREDGFPAAFCRRVVKMRPGTRVLLTARRAWIGAPERSWAKRAGAVDLLPACAAQRTRSTVAPLLRTLMKALEGESPDLSRMESRLSAVLRDRAPEPGFGGGAQAILEHLDKLGLDLAGLALRMRREGGLSVADRRYLMRTYEECFVGDAAVGWIARELGISRELAAQAGSALLEAGYIYHVVREQPFRDGHYYYRFAVDTPALAALDLGALIEAWRQPGGVEIRERSWFARSYAQCFVGSDAVAWLRTQELSLNEALIVGQRLIDCGVMHHVTDDHGFKDDTLYYRFYADELPPSPAM